MWPLFTDRQSLFRRLFGRKAILILSWNVIRPLKGPADPFRLSMTDSAHLTSSIRVPRYDEEYGGMDADRISVPLYPD